MASAFSTIFAFLAGAALILMILSIIHPKITLRFWKLRTRKRLGLFYLALFITFVIVGSHLDSITPEGKEKAEQARIEREKKSEQRHQDKLAKLEEEAQAMIEREKKSEQRHQDKLAKLEEEAQAIPHSDYEENLKAYQNLLELDPSNDRYTQKITYYQVKIHEAQQAAATAAEDKRKRSEATAKELAKREAKHGSQPRNSAWDGSVQEVKNYLKSVANDPGSLKYEGWSPVTYSEANGWVVTCDWRAKNAFGGYVRQVNTFYIRWNKVVAVE